MNRKDQARRLAAELQYKTVDACSDALADLGWDKPVETEPHPPVALPRAISIWSPRQTDDGLIFERPPVGPLGDHYATRFRIPARKTRAQRLVWLGESVAAGYLYAPHLTPAGLLTQQLDQLAPDTYDVVDLARTNERLETLVDTAQAALQLAPDRLFVFAGNNWNLLETPECSVYAPEAADRAPMRRLFDQGGVEAVIDHAGRKLAQKISRAMTALGEIHRQCPITLIIPEVNLADWHSFQPPAQLKGDNLERWYEIFHHAQSALQNQAWTDAVTHAFQLLELDDGACPTTYRILAQAYAGQDEAAKARAAAEAEVDAAYYAANAFLDAPRATTLAKTVQRRAAALQGFELIDLPASMIEYPGNQWFVDYCHLSLEGMHHVTSAVTQSLLGKSGQPPTLGKEHQATALLGAAIHGAHRHLPIGDKAATLRPWLAQALQICPEMRHTLLDLVEARCSDAPLPLTAAGERIRTSPFPLNLQHGLRYDYRDFDLILAIRDLLGDDVDARLQALALTQTWRDLAPKELWEPLAQYFPALMDDPNQAKVAHFQAPLPTTEFGYVLAKDATIELECVLRTPLNRNGEVRIDDQATATRSGWTKHRLILQGRRGLNKLCIHWPFPSERSHTHIHPCFGEIARLRVRLDTDQA